MVPAARFVLKFCNLLPGDPPVRAHLPGPESSADKGQSNSETMTFRNSMPLFSCQGHPGQASSLGASCHSSCCDCGVEPLTLPPSVPKLRLEGGWRAEPRCHPWNRTESERGRNVTRSKQLVHGRPCRGEGGWGEVWQADRQPAGGKSFEPLARFFGPGNQRTCPFHSGTAALTAGVGPSARPSLISRSPPNSLRS